MLGPLLCDSFLLPYCSMAGDFIFSAMGIISIDMLEGIVAINWEEDNSAQSKEDHYIGAFLPSFGRIS
jgi:hypothetical protein